MENDYKMGFDWNLYENLKSFKVGEQNIHKTSANIKLLFGNKILGEKELRELEFIANQERERIRLTKED
jgi:hypothetical protein